MVLGVIVLLQGTTEYESSSDFEIHVSQNQ